MVGMRTTGRGRGGMSGVGACVSLSLPVFRFLSFYLSFFLLLLYLFGGEIESFESDGWWKCVWLMLWLIGWGCRWRSENIQRRNHRTTARWEEVWRWEGKFSLPLPYSLYYISSLAISNYSKARCGMTLQNTYQDNRSFSSSLLIFITRSSKPSNSSSKRRDYHELVEVRQNHNPKHWGLFINSRLISGIDEEDGLTAFEFIDICTFGVCVSSCGETQCSCYCELFHFEPWSVVHISGRRAGWPAAVEQKPRKQETFARVCLVRAGRENIEK